MNAFRMIRSTYQTGKQFKRIDAASNGFAVCAAWSQMTGNA